MGFSNWVNPFEKMNEEQLKYLAQLGRVNFVKDTGDITLVLVKILSASTITTANYVLME